MLAGMRSATLAEVAAHGLHLALFGAGLVGVAVLLWVSRPRGAGRRSGRERARVEALRAAVRDGTLAAAGQPSPEFDDRDGNPPPDFSRSVANECRVAQTDEATA
jgi:hypothetical protein